MLSILEPQLIEILGLIITVVISYASLVFNSWASKQKLLSDIQIEEKHQRSLHKAAMSIALSVVNDGTHAFVKDKKKQIPAAVKASAADYIKRSVPDAVAALSPLPDVLDRIIVSKFEEILRERI